MKDYRAQQAWTKSRNLLLVTYKITDMFPTESAGLKNEIRKHCVAIPANISRGCGRLNKAEVDRFFKRSLHSASKLETQLRFAFNRHYLKNSDYKLLADETSGIITLLEAVLGGGTDRIN